jgi:two-component system sensor histidine kinase KdpD
VRIGRIRRLLASYVLSLALVGLFTGIVALVRATGDVSNASMLYLLAVLAAAVLSGLGPAIVAALASFAAFNFFFLQPRYTFTVADSEEWIALGLLLASGVITGQLASLVRERAREAERREREAMILYDVVRIMSAPGVRQALSDVAERLRTELDLGGALLMLGRESPISAEASAGDAESLALAKEAISRADMILAAGKTPSAATRGKPGRWIRVVHPRAPGSEPPGRGHRVHTVPVNIGNRQVASLVVVRRDGTGHFSPADDRLLSTVAHQLGLALQRLGLQQDAAEAEALRRTDDLRSALINAVSHDLRTPLSSIIAAAGSLLQEDVAWSEEEQRAFSQVVVDEARRLDRLVGNLLDLSRIESGNIQPEKGWYDLGSLVNEVAGRLRRITPAHTLTLNIPDQLPPVLFDYVEIDQVITNLLENAVNHTPLGTEITVTVRARRSDVEIEVADSGPGIPEESLANIFKPFYRAAERGTDGGSGLGLAVARGLVEAHGGHISVRNAPEGGARFVFTLPLSEQPAEAA